MNLTEKNIVISRNTTSPQSKRIPSGKFSHHLKQANYYFDLFIVTPNVSRSHTRPLRRGHAVFVNQHMQSGIAINLLVLLVLASCYILISAPARRSLPARDTAFYQIRITLEINFN